MLLRFDTVPVRQAGSATDFYYCLLFNGDHVNDFWGLCLIYLEVGKVFMK